MPFYSIGLIVLLIVIIVRQGSLSRKLEEEISELKSQLLKIARNQEKMMAGKAVVPVEKETKAVEKEEKAEETVPASEEVRPVEELRPAGERWNRYMPQELQTEPEPVVVQEVQKLQEVQEVPAFQPVMEDSEVLPIPVVGTTPEIPLQPELIETPVTEPAIEKPVVEEPVRQEPPAVPGLKRQAAAIPPPIRTAPKEVNYEKLIGENLFGKIGILILVIGVGFFVKYAIDQDWINETMRTILGFAIGSVLLFIAERLREKYRTFSSLLAGGAFGVFYLTVSIAFHYYHLFSQTVAFAILVVITVFMSALAILYDRRELAIISLVGGFLAPFIVSTGAGNYVVLFTYIAILNLGMFAISMYKKWAEIPIVSFVFTYIILGLYVLDSFIFGSGGITVVVAGRLLAFTALFYFIFLLPIILILKNEGITMNRVLLSVVIVNNFLFLGFGYLFLSEMALTFKAEGLLSLFIAIVNLLLALWLKKNEGEYRFLLYTMIGLVLTFVSITVPLQLEGHYITLFWASEMVLLLWLYARSQIRVYEYAAFIMVLLTGISFMLDVMEGHEIFATNLFTAVAAGVFAWLVAKYREVLSEARILSYHPWNAAMWIVSIVVFYYTFMNEFDSWDVYYTGYLKVLFTVLCIGGVSFVFQNRFPIKVHLWPYLIGIGVSALIPLLGTFTEERGGMAVLLTWVSIGVIIATLYYVARKFYEHYGVTSNFTIYLNVLATILWLAIINIFLYQVRVLDEGNAAFSIGLSIAGFVQMLLGMRLHQKVLRIISLVVFGIVLAKLALIDLWALPTIGKIIVFIMLGALLLVLSFLYQKLKNVLFKDDDQEDTH